MNFEIELKLKTNRISKLPPQIQVNVVKALEAGMMLAESKAKKSYLSGPRPDRLGVVTGRLRSSIMSRVEKGTPGGIFATGILSAQNVVYSWIHEFGGKTRPHPIEAKNVPYLIFYWERIGRWVKIKKVNHPGSNIPPRPYMDYAIRMTKPKIEALIDLSIDKSYQVT